MKAGDLIRFTKTGVMGLIVEVREEEPDLAGPRALVYCAWGETQRSGQQEKLNENLWFYLDYLLKCAEPADFDHSAMRGGVL